MSNHTTLTDDGLDWISERAVGGRDGESFYAIAVGDGTTTPSGTDTSLANELHRANVDGSTVEIRATSNIGELVGRITITGGQEVAAGADIQEFGLFTETSDILIYREVRDNPVTLDSGDRKTFEFRFTFADE